MLIYFFVSEINSILDLGGDSMDLVKKMRKQTTSIMLIVLLTFSLIPGSTWAAEKQGKEVTEKVMISLLEEVISKIDDVEQGKLDKGTILYAKELESSYKVQWNDTYIEIGKTVAELIKLEEAPRYIEYEDSAVIGWGKLRKNIHYDGSELNFKLIQGTSYAVIGQTETTYHILLANRMVEIPQENVVYKPNEKSDEELVQPTAPKSSQEDRVDDVKVEKIVTKESKGKNKLDETVITKEEDDKQANAKKIKAAPVYGDYFEVIYNNVPVFDNRADGELAQVGTLVKGQTYKRISDYGDWHRIQYGEHYGYVHQSSTKPSSSSKVGNLYNSYNNSSEKFIAGKEAIVYDNSGSSLVPFTTFREGEKYPIVSDYGNWYRVIAAGRIGYVQKTDVSGYFTADSSYFEVTVDRKSVV